MEHLATVRKGSGQSVPATLPLRRSILHVRGGAAHYPEEHILSVSPAQPAAAPLTLRAIEEFQRVCQGFAMYGAKHPATIAAIDSCIRACNQAHGIRITARGVRHFCQELCLSDCPELELLCTRLTSLRIASLSISQHVARADVQAIVEMWAGVPHGSHWNNDNAAALRKQTHGNIDAAETNYQGLQVVDGVAAGPEIEIDWSCISADLARVTAGSGGVTAAELAATVNANLDAQLLGLPSEVLESAATALASASPQERAAAEARLSHFFGSLSAHLRDASTQIDVSRPVQSIRALSELSATIPVSAMLNSVEGVADSNLLASPDGVKLLAQLVWLSRDHEKLRGRLQTVISQLRPMVEPLHSDADPLQSAIDLLSDVVKSRDVNRDEYESLLASIAAVPVSPEHSRRVHPGWTTQSAQVHAVSIAVDLALDPQTPVDNLESTFNHIERSIDSLIEANEFELLAEVSQALKAIRMRDIPVAAVQAADRCKIALCSPKVVAKLSVLPKAAAAQSQDLSAIFAHCGGAAVAELVQSVLRGNFNVDPAHIVNHPALNIREFITGLFKCDVQIIKTVAQLDNITPDRRARLAHAMLSHDNSDLRILAYRIFERLFPQWPASLVSHAFVEGNSEVSMMAIDRLGDDPTNHRAAARLLAGGFGDDPDARLFDAGILALEKLGAASALKEIRAKLLKKPSPTNLLRAARAFAASRRAAKVHS